MAGDPERRIRKVMFEVLSKAARYSDGLWIRHFVCDGGVRRTSPKGVFLLQRKALLLLEEKIRPAAYRWRVDCDCRRDCVSFQLELALPLVARYLSLARYQLIFHLYTYTILIRDRVVMFTICVS